MDPSTSIICPVFRRNKTFKVRRLNIYEAGCLIQVVWSFIERKKGRMQASEWIVSPSVTRDEKH